MLEEGSKIDSKYELKMILTFNNEQTKTMYNSFNYLIKEWQYNAIPLSLEKEELANLKGIQIIFDYSNNYGKALFYGIELMEGYWNYKEYDDEEKLIYTEEEKKNTIIMIKRKGWKRRK